MKIGDMVEVLALDCSQSRVVPTCSPPASPKPFAPKKESPRNTRRSQEPSGGTEMGSDVVVLHPIAAAAASAQPHDDQAPEHRGRGEVAVADRGDGDEDEVAHLSCRVGVCVVRGNHLARRCVATAFLRVARPSRPTSTSADQASASVLSASCVTSRCGQLTL